MDSLSSSFFLSSSDSSAESLIRSLSYPSSIYVVKKIIQTLLHDGFDVNELGHDDSSFFLAAFL